MGAALLVFLEVTQYKLRQATRKLICSSSTTPTAAVADFVLEIHGV